MTNKQESQEFGATCCWFTCQSLIGYGIGLILGIPPLILVSLGRSALATVPCGSGRLSHLPEAGITVYLIECGTLLLLILGSLFWQKSGRLFIFGIGLGLLTMIIPLLLTESGIFSDSWQRCFHLEG